uniref:Uncharacterized protein n=1 Tax=Oryza barthii TaxID=65489 RepID=A0A0D3EPU6_9ORYZ
MFPPSPPPLRPPPLSRQPPEQKEASSCAGTRAGGSIAAGCGAARKATAECACFMRSSARWWHDVAGGLSCSLQALAVPADHLILATVEDRHAAPTPATSIPFHPAAVGPQRLQELHDIAHGVAVVCVEESDVKAGADEAGGEVHHAVDVALPQRREDEHMRRHRCRQVRQLAPLGRRGYHCRRGRHGRRDVRALARLVDASRQPLPASRPLPLRWRPREREEGKKGKKRGGRV